MSKTPKVSVIIPIYNVEKYLRKCLDSVINQTFNDIEIICINDGSPDNSLQILEEYAKKDNRIVVINQKNSGVSSARNRGLEIMQGTYVTFLDPDDWFEPECLEIAVAEMEKDSDVDMVYWNSNVVDMRNTPPELYERYQERYSYEMEGKYKPTKKIIKRIPLNVAAKLIKASIIKSLDLKFLDYKYSEDTLFYCMYFAKLNSIFFIKKALYNYVLVPDSASVQYSPELGDSEKVLISHIDMIIKAFHFYQRLDLLTLFNAKVFPRLMFHVSWDLNFVPVLTDDLKSHLKHLVEVLPSNYNWGKRFNYIKQEKFYKFGKKKNKNKSFSNFLKQIPNMFFSIYTAYDCGKKYKVINIFGIKIKIKRNQPMITSKKCKNRKKKKNTLLNKILRVKSLKQYISAEIFAANKINELHHKTFPKFKNCHKDKEIAIIASGPTMKYYRQLSEVVHIGVNKTFQRKDLKLDYIFVQDMTAINTYIDDIIKYPCNKFFGSYLANEIDWIDKITIPEKYMDIPDINYYFSGFPRNSYYPYLENYGLMDLCSVVFPAVQFALYTGAKKIYLVGCDCSIGYFDNSNALVDATKLIGAWQNEFKKYKDTYYPDVEIISINPVGLKGLFKDVYTKEFLNTNNELLKEGTLTVLEDKEDLICHQ